MKHPDEIADDIKFTLKQMGFRVLYYKAMTTNSHYIKVDGGIVGSIRISDHRSFKSENKWFYRFNILTSLDQKMILLSDDTRKTTQHFYPATDDYIRQMLSQIQAYRKIKKAQYKVAYDTRVQRAILKAKRHRRLNVFKEI